MYLQYKENQTIAEIKEQQKEQKIKHSIDQRIAKRTKIYKMYGSNQKRNYKSPFTVEKSESFIIAQNYKLENQINPQNRAKKRKRKKKKGWLPRIIWLFRIVFSSYTNCVSVPPFGVRTVRQCEVYIYIYSFLPCIFILFLFFLKLKLDIALN